MSAGNRGAVELACLTANRDNRHGTGAEGNRMNCPRSGVGNPATDQNLAHRGHKKRRVRPVKSGYGQSREYVSDLDAKTFAAGLPHGGSTPSPCTILEGRIYGAERRDRNDVELIPRSAGRIRNS